MASLKAGNLMGVRRCYQISSVINGASGLFG